MRSHSVAILLALAVVASGCSFLGEKKVDYKSAGSLPPLEAPPDLVVPSANKRYALPGAVPAGSATFSAYSQESSSRPTAANPALLPAVDKVRVERAGAQRWLVVDRPPAEVWPRVKEFWQETGFIVNVDNPELGVMETDWAENRAKIPQDAVRNFLGKAIDALYSTGERDKFRTRLEPVPDGKGTEIYISHKGMIEVYEGTQGGGDEGKGRTMWQPRPTDPELEAEMLRRLMVRFGIQEARANTLVASGVEAQAVVGKAADGSPLLTVKEPFDRAWRRVGLALDRVGFVVEDRDRVAGVYFVRYAAPDAETAKEKQGFLSKLAFWRDDAAQLKSDTYRVQVAGKEAVTEVKVVRDNGSAATDETGSRIIRLLYDQLK